MLGVIKIIVNFKEVNVFLGLKINKQISFFLKYARYLSSYFIINKKIKLIFY